LLSIDVPVVSMGFYWDSRGFYGVLLSFQLFPRLSIEVPSDSMTFCNILLVFHDFLCYSPHSGRTFRAFSRSHDLDRWFLMGHVTPSYLVVTRFFPQSHVQDSFCSCYPIFCRAQAVIFGLVEWGLSTDSDVSGEVMW
jgi:hypothetical protein